MFEAVAKPSSTFMLALQEIRADFLRLTNHFSPLGDCVPFSPQAYNAISATIMESLYTCMEQIETLHGNIQFFSNLGVVLFCELQHAACTHYFKEYERICRFVDTRPEPGSPVKPQPGFRRSMFARAARKVSGMATTLADSVMSRTDRRVCWAGGTTFSWQSLASQLHGRGIRLYPVKCDGALHIPAFVSQVKVLELWAQDLHQRIANIMGTNSQVVHPFGADDVKFYLERLCSIPVMSNSTCDLVVTGTLGNLQARAVALQAQPRGVPVLTLHHGANYFIFDEPYYALYEGALPDMKIIYGSIEKQRSMGTLGSTVNLAGRSIQFYSRSDPDVQRIFAPHEIKPCPSLRDLTAVYIGATFEGVRNGPYRDVHPATYLAWQERLLAWLEKETGQRPLVRPHPKRPSTRYDPAGYQLLNGDMTEVLELADFFVIDFPTTSLAYTVATNKPVLFFDIGLRRLHPAALEAIRGRCHYAATDLLYPDEGFAAMKADLSRQCIDTFTPTFSLALDNKEEVESVADAVCSVLLHLSHREMASHSNPNAGFLTL